MWLSTFSFHTTNVTPSIILLFVFQKYLILGWIIGPALLLTMVFGPTKKSLNSFEAILFTGLGKTAWSIGVAWIIVACATGHGGIVNRILSAKSLLPYSRMTYTAYLINPLVITFVLMMCEAPVHLDFLTLVNEAKQIFNQCLVIQ